MRRLAIILLVLAFPLPLHAGEAPPLKRSEGFRLLFEPLHRSIEETHEQPFKDIPTTDPSFTLLTYAKARGILNDDPQFFPDEPLHLNDALLWLLRSRNVAPASDITYDTITTLTERYALLPDAATAIGKNDVVTQEQLQSLMQTLDTFLRTERHTISFYGEEFRGNHTAFGESFDPDSFTAAHRTLPYNTLVRVTYHGDVSCQLSAVSCQTKSTIVRINDRGPYVDGRDMDLSLAAFEALASRSRGILTSATFERLWSADVVNACPTPVYQRRLGQTLFDPGIPRKVTQGTLIALSANRDFRLIEMRTPGGKRVRSKTWTRRGETLTLNFEKLGIYRFILHEDAGRRGRFRTEVVGRCSELLRN